MALINLHPGLFSAYFRNHFVKLNFLIILLLNIFLWLFLAYNSRDFAGQIPLHYNIYFGIDSFGPWYKIFWLPIFGLAIFLFNFVFGALIYEFEKILSYLLIGTASLAGFLLILAAVFIILVNY